MSEESKQIPAFPQHSWQRIDNVEEGRSEPGMTLRDYFAAKAMLADLNYQGLEGREDTDHIAKMAYQMADSMLKTRNAE